MQRFFGDVMHRYDRSLVWVIDHQAITLLVALATFALTVLLYIMIPKGLFPTQDTGQLQGRIEAAQDVSYERMAQLQQAAAKAILDDPDVENLSSFVGVDAANNTMLHTGSMLINLKKGHGNQQATMDRLRERVGQQVAGVTLYLQPTQDLTIDAETGPTQYRVSLEGVDSATITLWMGKLIERLRFDPQVRNVSSDAGAQGLAAYIDVEPRHRLAPGHHRELGRRRAVQRVRPAHRLDHLHRDQPVPRDPRSAARAGRQCGRSGQAEPDHQRRHADAAVGVRDASPSSRRRCRSRTSRSTRRAR